MEKIYIRMETLVEAEFEEETYRVVGIDGTKIEVSEDKTEWRSLGENLDRQMLERIKTIIRL